MALRRSAFNKNVQHSLFCGPSVFVSMEIYAMESALHWWSSLLQRWPRSPCSVFGYQLPCIMLESPLQWPPVASSHTEFPRSPVAVIFPVPVPVTSNSPPLAFVCWLLSYWSAFQLISVVATVANMNAVPAVRAARVLSQLLGKYVLIGARQTIGGFILIQSSLSLKLDQFCCQLLYFLRVLSGCSLELGWQVSKLNFHFKWIKEKHYKKVF